MAAHTEYAVFDDLRARIDAEMADAIARLIAEGPDHDHELIGRVYRWARHYLDNGGKRMHGLSVVLAYQACGGTDLKAILKVAAGFQLYHHHTLVHDDIYDEDLARRGWPTTHVAFADWLVRAGRAAPHGESRLYTGDAARRGAITAYAYGKMMRALCSHLIGSAGYPKPLTLDALQTLNWHDLYDNAAQLKDVFHEGGAMPDSAGCLDNAWLKTGRLFEVGATVGARLAGAGGDRVQAVERWAGRSALAYQLQDDLEDFALDSEKGQGRGVGNDLVYCKPTYVFALAREMADGPTRGLLEEWLRAPGVGRSIGDVLAALESSGALAACRTKVEDLVGEAAQAVREAHPPFAADMVETMVRFARYFVSSEYWKRTIDTDAARAGALIA